MYTSPATDATLAVPGGVNPEAGMVPQPANGEFFSTQDEAQSVVDCLHRLTGVYPNNISVTPCVDSTIAISIIDGAATYAPTVIYGNDGRKWLCVQWTIPGDGTSPDIQYTINAQLLYAQIQNTPGGRFYVNPDAADVTFR